MEISEFYQQLSSLPSTTYVFSIGDNKNIVATGNFEAQTQITTTERSYF